MMMAVAAAAFVAAAAVVKMCCRSWLSHAVALKKIVKQSDFFCFPVIGGGLGARVYAPVAPLLPCAPPQIFYR